MFEIRLGQVQEQLQEFSAKVLFMFSLLQLKCFQMSFDENLIERLQL